MVGDLDYSFKHTLYAPNKTDCTPRSPVTTTARGREKRSDEQGIEKANIMGGHCCRDKIKMVDQL
jgi:hypothetical protein